MSHFEVDHSAIISVPSSWSNDQTDLSSDGQYREMTRSKSGRRVNIRAITAYINYMISSPSLCQHPSTAYSSTN